MRVTYRIKGRQPMFDSANYSKCHLRGGTVRCGKCHHIALCMDAIPFDYVVKNSQIDPSKCEKKELV